MTEKLKFLRQHLKCLTNQVVGFSHKEQTAQEAAQSLHLDTYTLCCCVLQYTESESTKEQEQLEEKRWD